jgi:hypothetical protein
MSPPDWFELAVLILFGLAMLIAAAFYAAIFIQRRRW